MTLLTTSYFPNVYYFAVIQSFPTPIFIEAKEMFIKQTYRNRCMILSPNGPQILVVPVKKGRAKLRPIISEIEIDYSHAWIQKHLNSIKTAYGSAPFFRYYFDDIAQILKHKHPTLFALNHEILNYFLNILNINKEIKTTHEFISTYESGNINDLRYITSTKFLPPVEFPAYNQVFENKFNFIPNLSVLDLIFNLGPEAELYLQKIRI